MPETNDNPVATDELEEQRYGRNKHTAINKTYINGGEYRRKFDTISETPELNKLLYQLAKKMLLHRSGTKHEDMYWIDPDKCEVISEEHEDVEDEKIVYSDKTKRVISEYKSASDKRLIVLHTHPSSYPPSIYDLNSCFDNDYMLGLIICHDGRIYVYSAQEVVNVSYYNLKVADNIKAGYNEDEAQIKAIEDLQRDFKIKVKEVGAS